MMRHLLRAEPGPPRRPTRARRHGRCMERAAAAQPVRGVVATIIAACLLIPIHARAGDLSGGVAITSQLVDRGLAITPAAPALQGAVSWTTPSGWSLALSGGVELDSPGHVAAAVVQLGRTFLLSENWRIQTGILYYHYASRLRANVYEPGVYLAYRDLLTFGVSCAYFPGDDKHKLHPAADLNFHRPLAGDFWITGGVGITRYTVSYGNPEHYYTGYYRYGQAGLMWSHGTWQVKLDRVLIDPAAPGYLRWLAASSWLATISWSF